MRSRLLLLIMVLFAQLGRTQIADALPGCLVIANQQGMGCGGGTSFMGINGLGQFEMQNIDGIFCCAVGGDFNAYFEFETIDISCFSNVSIAFDYSAMGNFEDQSPVAVFGCTGTPLDNGHDQIVFAYSLDGAPEVQDLYVHGSTALDFTGQWNVGGLNGNTLTIKVYASNKATAEHFYFENLIISGTAAAPSAGPDIPVCGTGPVMLMGSGTGTWSGGLGTFSDPTDPNATYTPDPTETGSVTLTFSCGVPSSTCAGVGTSDDMVISFTGGSNIMATLTSSGVDLCVGECLDINFAVTGGAGGPYDLSFNITVPPLPPTNIPITIPGSMQAGFLCTTTAPIPSYDAATNTLFIPDFLSNFTITLVSVSEAGCNGTVNATPIMFTVIDPPTVNAGCTLEDCVLPGTTSNFVLTNAEPCVNGTAGMGFLWFEDLAMTIPILNPTNYPVSSNTTVYVVADNGTCQSPPVAVDLIIFSITAPAMITGICTDGGTPTDPLDDIIIFDLDPQGSAGMIGMSYTVTVSSGTVTPTMGIYGAPTTFQLQAGSAGLGNVIITVTDNNYAGCVIPSISILDPGPCSSMCDITLTGLINVTCNDNNTPANTSDDFITFQLDPQGVNLASTYMVFTSIGSVAPNIGAYGMLSTFTMQLGSVGAGDFVVTIIDSGSASCVLTDIVIDPPPCGMVNCGIVSENIFQELCGPNQTPSDPNDDFWTFGLDPTGNNLGTTYTISVDIGTVMPSFGTYGQATVFQLQDGSAMGGPVTVTLTDDTDPMCTWTFVVTPTGPCSNDCEITDLDLDNVICNANATLTDDADDYITFTINPTGNGLMGNYNVFVSAGGVTPNTGNYANGVSNFSLNQGSAGGGPVTLTIVDAADPTCTAMVVINDPGSCSNNCTITVNTMTPICDPNGTPSDPNDDTFSFMMEVTGSNVGAMWSATDPNTSVDIYSTMVLMGPYLIANGDLNFIVADVTDPSCAQSVMVVAPSDCSNFCNLVTAVIVDPCFDNGTPMNPADDTYTFTLTVLGSNTGATWTADDPNTTTAAYGVPVVMGPYPIGAGGILNFTITDDVDPSCFAMESVIIPSSCSGACAVVAQLQGFECFNGGTPSDPSDDTYTIDILVSGQGTGWMLDDVLNSSGSYGVITTLGPYLLSAGNWDMTFSDDTDPNCDVAFIIYQAPVCNFPCEMDANGLAQISCDDNGTQSNTSDDFVTFVLNPTGGTLSASGYTVIGISGITPTTGLYGQNTMFSLPAGSALSFPISLTIVDNDDNACTFPVEITEPAGCFDPCGMDTNGLANVTCNDGGTPNNTNDDFVSFVLNPTGSSLSLSGYTVMGFPGITPTNGFYGQNTLFSLPAGSASAMNFPISLTIVDSDDINCTFPVEILDPGCATPCLQTLDAGQNQTIDCDNPTANLTAVSSEVPLTIEWLNAMGLNVGNTLDIMVTESGIYTINVEYIDGCMLSGMVEVIDNSLNAPDATIVGPSMPFVDCVVFSVELFSAGISDVTYTWTYSGMSINAGSLEVLAADVGSNVVVTLTAVDDLTGCSASSMVTITDLSDNPNIIITPVQTTCLNGSVILDASNSDPFTGLWTDANGTNVSSAGPGLSQGITEDGWYYYTLINLANGCFEMDSIEVNNDNPPGAGLSITNSPDGLNTFNLLGLPTGINSTSVSFQWSPTEGLSCTDCADPVATITEDTEYTLTYYFGESCSLTETVTLNFKAPVTSEYIPTAFSPNDDGVNDEFGIFTDSEALVAVFYIYDRWGEKVFEAENFSTLTNNKTWNGRFKNNRLNPGVFVYQIFLVDSNGEEKELYGDVTLIR